MEPKTKVAVVNESIERMMSELAAAQDRDPRLDVPAPHSAHSTFARAISIADREIMRIQEFRKCGIPFIERQAERKVKRMNKALASIENAMAVFYDSFKR